MAQTSYIMKKNQTRKAYLSWEKELKDEDKTWFEHRKMTEGEYQKYVDLTSKVKLGSRKEKDDRAEMDMMLGSTREFLLTNLFVDWNAVDEDGKPIPATAGNILKMPPEVVKEWIDDIYDFNPILKPEEESEDKVLGEQKK